MTALRATSVWLTGPRRVELRREFLPALGPADVQARALVSAISHGTEMLVYRGEVAPDLELDLPTLAGSFEFPIKYGYATVSRIEQRGADVRDLEPGELVFAHHPHQSAFVMPAQQVVRLPGGVDPEAAVFLANVETAINVLLDAHPRYAETVVVFGQGVVGLLVSQLLRRAGARLIIAVEPVARRAELARALGVDVVLAPSSSLLDSIRDLTNGIGADLVIEISGQPAALQSAIDCAAFQAAIVVASWYGRKSVCLDLGRAFHRKRLRLISSQVSHVDPALMPRWDRHRRLEVALDSLRHLNLGALVSHRVPLERAAEAYALIDEHPDTTVQVLLTYPDTDADI